MTRKTNIDFFFEETLIDFYSQSNEVEEFNSTFKTIIYPYLKKKTNKQIKWLEVGIGNGEKTLKAAKLFDLKPKITFIEPSNNWINELIISGNLDELKTCSDISGTHRKFEDILVDNNWFNFDFISFIQVLYEPHIVKSLFDFIDNNKNTKSYTLLINLENEENDLYQLRKKIAQGNNIPFSQLCNLEQELKKRKIKYEKHISKHKKLNVSVDEIVNTKNHWFYPFLLGCSKTEFKNIDRNFKIFIIDTLSNHFKKRNEINIDDCSLIIDIA